MCLVAAAWKTHPRWHLLLLGNRDEFHARPTAPLAAWDNGVRAGRDLQSGGTWIGLAPDGRVAVVTNVRDPFAPPRPDTSRGALPVSFLAGNADAIAHAERTTTEAARFAPFNLLLADADACVYLGNHPRVEHRVVAPGVHGMSNGGFDVQWPKTRDLCALLEKWVEREREDFDALWRALADERIAPDEALPHTGVGLERERMLSAAFIRNPLYGTRASTIVAVDHAGKGWIGERRFGPDGVFLGETTLRIGN